MKWLMFLFLSTLLLTGCGSFTFSDDEDGEVSIDFFGLFSGDSEDAITVTDKDGSEQSIGFEQDDDGSISVSGTGDDGEETFSFGAGGSSELHEEFPDDIPFPDTAEIFGTQRVADNDEVMHTVQFVFEEDANDVFELYKDYIQSQGYDNVQEMQADHNLSVQGGMEDSDEAMSLTISSYDDEDENMAVLILISGR
ncbi:hypothetical protein [Salisediminibacterium beveridgei]|uniref:Lipoprotein n=1 Tax=Salisediminibacterium beveridgei TaxID=632773 RepID=A0A1D7QRU9_9BACI|nr:hypothetical protein [Salisediminibacterium beveridgei]AOM81721.1 hypothetical protein BBEV_0327 [Salisediminibacterium beveridgei]